MRLIADFYYYVLKREGMGLGDGKLLAMIGAVLGLEGAAVRDLRRARSSGALISLPLARGGAGGPAAQDAPRDGRGPSLRARADPLRPFLALGALIYLFAGPELLHSLGA